MDTKSNSVRIYREEFMSLPIVNEDEGDGPVLLCTYTGTGYFEQTIWAVIPTYFHHYTSVTSHGVAFLTEEEVMERVKAIRGRLEVWQRRIW